MSLFNSDFVFKGKHAEMVKKIYEALGSGFTYYDIFKMSISLGITFGLKADVDDNSKTTTAKIFLQKIQNEENDIKFFYQLLMLSDDNHCPSFTKKSDKAFRYIEHEEGKIDEEYFEKVLLGGLEYLYNEIFAGAISKIDIYRKMDDFLACLDDE